MIRSLVLLFCTFVAASAVDFTGTWKLDTTKSKYVGMPAPKQSTVTYTAKGGGYEYTMEGTSSTGEAIHITYNYAKDGEEVPVSGSPNWDAFVFRGGMTAKASVVMKRGGKGVGVATRTVGADGKTMTISGKLTLPDGKKANYSAVYNKQ